MSGKGAFAQRNAKAGMGRLCRATGFCALFALDRATKLWALAALPEETGGGHGVLSLFRNRGLSFSLFADVLILVPALSVVAVACLALLYARARHPLSRAGALCMLAGATGNLADRAVLGYVVDWLRIASLHVNLADAFICAGAALLLMDAVRRR